MTTPSQNDVRRHYESFPFPSGSTPHLTQHWTELIGDYFKTHNLKIEEKNFLDAGCGTGDNLLNFANEFFGLNFTGIDLSSNSIEIAKTKLQKQRLPNVNFFHSLISEHRPKDPYDFISCLGVLHHCQDPELNLSHLLELLKPGGHLFLDVYGYFGYLVTERTQKAINLLQPDFSDGIKRREVMEWCISQFLNITPPSDTTHPRYIGLADGFLVPIARSYRIMEIIHKMKESGLLNILWWDVPKIIEEKIHYKNFRGEIFDKNIPKILKKKLLSLTQHSRYEFFELCFAPFDYFLVGQKEG
jgi:ubiquinone/menaquinone biosynthesis C-methylase UbiE